MMWPTSAFGFRVFWDSWSSWVSWISCVSWSYRFPCTDWLRVIQKFMVFCCDKFPGTDVQQSILFPSLRTRRCVVIGISFSSYVRFSWIPNLSTWGASWRSRTVHRWRTRRNSDGQAYRRRLWFCHNPVILILFLRPLRRRFGAADQAEILSATERAEKADVEQMKKIVPFVTCETAFCQYVCNLVFGVDVPNLNLRIQVDPVKQPSKSNSVGSGHMSRCRDSCLR